MKREHPPKPANDVEPKPKKAAANQGAKSKPKAKKQFKPYYRARGGGAKQVSDLVPHIGRAAFRRFGFVQSSIITRWPEIVGETHSKVCSPESIRFPAGEKCDGTLQLVVLPAYAPLIQQVIPEIMERVNRFFGFRSVAKVKIRQGKVTPPDAVQKRSAPIALKPVPIELGESLRDIGDPELHAVLESLARSFSPKEDEKQ